MIFLPCGMLNLPLHRGARTRSPCPLCHVSQSIGLVRLVRWGTPLWLTCEGFVFPCLEHISGWMMKYKYINMPGACCAYLWFQDSSNKPNHRCLRSAGGWPQCLAASTCVSWDWWWLVSLSEFQTKRTYILTNNDCPTFEDRFHKELVLKGHTSTI